MPFPFVERGGAKRRPALVVSSEAFAPSHAVLAMITTSGRRTWPGDVELLDYGEAGLERPCFVRLKLFTLDRRLILRTAGRLSGRDRKRVGASLRRFLAPTGRAAG